MLHAFSFAEPLKLNQLRGGESVEEGKCVVHWPQEKAYEERCQKSAHKTLVFLGDQIGSTFPWVALKQPFPTAPLPPVTPLLPFCALLPTYPVQLVKMSSSQPLLPSTAFLPALLQCLLPLCGLLWTLKSLNYEINARKSNLKNEPPVCLLNLLTMNEWMNEWLS